MLVSDLDRVDVASADHFSDRGRRLEFYDTRVGVHCPGYRALDAIDPDIGLLDQTNSADKRYLVDAPGLVRLDQLKLPLKPVAGPDGLIGQCKGTGRIVVLEGVVGAGVVEWITERPRIERTSHDEPVLAQRV